MLSFSDVDKYLVKNGANSSRLSEAGLVKYDYDGENAAFINSETEPLQLSVRCNKELGRHLSAKYESVMPGHKLDPSKWITLIASGQLNDEEVYDLINHAISLAKNNDA